MFLAIWRPTDKRHLQSIHLRAFRSISQCRSYLQAMICSLPQKVSRNFSWRWKSYQLRSTYVCMLTSTCSLAAGAMKMYISLFCHFSEISSGYWRPFWSFNCTRSSSAFLLPLGYCLPVWHILSGSAIYFCITHGGSTYIDHQRSLSTIWIYDFRYVRMLLVK